MKKIALCLLVALALFGCGADWCERNSGIYAEDKAKSIYDSMAAEKSFVQKYERRCASSSPNR